MVAPVSDKDVDPGIRREHDMTAAAAALHGVSISVQDLLAAAIGAVLSALSIHAVVGIAVQLCFNVRVYSRFQHIKDVATYVAKNKLVTLGEEYHESGLVPMYAFGFRPFALVVSTATLTLDGTRTITVRVVRSRRSGPVVPEPLPQICNSGSHISVAYASARGFYKVRLERAVPRRAPPDVVAAADAVSDRMLEAFVAEEQENQVFVLHGRQGCGKSTAVRMLALKLDATLYEYDPTKNGSLLTLLEHGTGAPGETRRSVVAYEEFDASMRRIAAGTVRVMDKKRGCEVYDKPSWNSNIDGFRRSSDAIMVMTTNEPYDAIPGLLGGDTSYMRQGRVNAHFEWDDDGTVARKEPFGAANGVPAPAPAPPSSSDGDDDCDDEWQGDDDCDDDD